MLCIRVLVVTMTTVRRTVMTIPIVPIVLGSSISASASAATTPTTMETPTPSCLVFLRAAAVAAAANFSATPPASAGRRPAR